MPSINGGRSGIGGSHGGRDNGFIVNSEVLNGE